MAFADLLIAVFNVGTSWTYNLYHDWWCQAVVNPLRKRPLSRRRSLYAISVIWALSTTTALPFAFAAQYALPLFVLSFTFARIALAFRSTDMATDNNSKGNSHTRAKSKAVKMLALMVFAFMFCWLPYHLYHTFELNNFLSMYDPRTLKYIYLGIYWVAMSSTAYNPIIYCFANERFRIGFRFVFRWIPLVRCRREEYEYSQLFPEKLRSMAISLQLGRKGHKEESRRDANGNKEYSSAGRKPPSLRPQQKVVKRGYRPAVPNISNIISSKTEEKQKSQFELALPIPHSIQKRRNYRQQENK
uniref:G_PROTEIN_RECEP_F1_2 domain-containing protein n=1 Tax=Heterorhabditis bacteriophora TaxID=37862 RepID=A0A1I7XSQ2_HETBA